MKRIGVALALVASLCALGAGTAEASICGKTFTHNVTLHSNVRCKHAGIIVGADNVVVNLNGFTLTGPASNAVAGDTGIEVVDFNNVTIKNGIVRLFFDGILLDGATNSFVKHVTALTNQGPGGIHLKSSASGNLIKRSLARNNVGHGIFIENSPSTTVLNTVAKKNIGNGVLLAGAATIGTSLQSVVGFHNVGTGFEIFGNTTATTMDGLRANENAGTGIEIGASDGGTTVANSTANDNQGNGITAQDPSQDAGGNSASGNGGTNCVNVTCA